MKNIDLEQLKKLVNDGKNSIEIGKILGLSKKTVRKKLKSIGMNHTALHPYKQKKEGICEFCNNIFIKKNKKQKFCSHSCSATFHNVKKSGKKLEEYKNDKINKISKYNIDGTEGMNINEKIKFYWDTKLMETSFEELSWERKRKRVILEQKNKCNRCDNNKWLGYPITLEIDHKDGNNKNNNRENLEGLCPNCHSMTDTWRGKNRKDLKNNKKLTPEDYVNAFLNTKNVRQSLIYLGLAPKGGNYPRMYEFLRAAGIYVK